MKNLEAAFEAVVIVLGTVSPTKVSSENDDDDDHHPHSWGEDTNSSYDSSSTSSSSPWHQRAVASRRELEEAVALKPRLEEAEQAKAASVSALRVSERFYSQKCYHFQKFTHVNMFVRVHITYKSTRS